jgi:hypothetical protein
LANIDAVETVQEPSEFSVRQNTDDSHLIRIALFPVSLPAKLANQELWFGSGVRFHVNEGPEPNNSVWKDPGYSAVQRWDERPGQRNGHSEGESRCSVKTGTGEAGTGPNEEYHVKVQAVGDALADTAVQRR